jgi:muramidase (phage lysozyme)
MAYLGALPFVIDGFFDEAVKRLREEWTSLPGAKESGWAGGMEQARAYFVARGGRLASKGQG